MEEPWNGVRAGWDDAVDSVDTTINADDVLPARFRIKRLWLRRGRTPIMITGAAGSGKTLMYDALMNEIGFDYTPKGMSLDAERHRVGFRAESGRTGASASVLVVPGQSSPERTRSLHQPVGKRRRPFGLIHVVCWGYNRRWDLDPDREFEEHAARLPEELRHRASDEVPKRIRRVNLSAELRDFREVCKILAAPGVRQRLRWLVIAVAKSDLYWPDLTSARRHYLPAPTRGRTESEFCRELRKLVRNDAGLAERLAVVPFAGYPEPHDFGNGVEPQPQLSSQQIASLRNNFCNVVGGML